MLGWQESTLKIHFLELYGVFDNLVTVATQCGNRVTMFIQPCDNLATTLRQFKNTRLCQGCHMVASWQPCDNVRTTLSQPCDSFKIQSCAKVVPRL